MKRVEKIAICLASGLMLTAGMRADVTTLPGDPYATVVTRNVFGLNPPAPPAPPVDATPPPKIIPNGIMTIFGQVQVLFKVTSTPKPGGPPPTGDQSYILSEGQRQDDIEVIKIDERNSIVTFNNHGETQQLPLVVTAPSSTPAPTPSLAAAGGGGSGGNNFGNPGNGASGISGVAGVNGSANSSNQNNGSNLGNGQPRSNTFNAASQIPPGMTEEVQTVAIEANRELTRQQVDSGEMPPLPITPLTPAEAPEAGGNPPSNPEEPK